MLNCRAQEPPPGLTTDGRKDHVLTPAVRGQNERIILHTTMFGTATLPDRACPVSGQFPEPNGVKTAITITTWYTANYSL